MWRSEEGRQGEGDENESLTFGKLDSCLSTLNGIVKGGLTISNSSYHPSHRVTSKKESLQTNMHSLFLSSFFYSTVLETINSVFCLLNVSENGINAHFNFPKVKVTYFNFLFCLIHSPNLRQLFSFKHKILTSDKVKLENIAYFYLKNVIFS